MRLHWLTATLTVLTLASRVPAQEVFGGPDPDRKASNVFVFNDSREAIVGASISYSQPSWKDSYNGMLAQLKGNYTRLGKNWWTTFDTVGALEIGGTKIEAGSYYLGLFVDKDGAFSLLIFDSKRAMKAGLLPFTTALYTGEAKPDARVPLTFAKDSQKDVVVKMEIEIAADKKSPATGTFSIRWGKHELSAPVKFHLAGSKDATTPKK